MQAEPTPGSIVMLGDNLGPEYELIHVHEDQAWVRSLCWRRESQIAPRDRLRFYGGPVRGEAPGV